MTAWHARFTQFLLDETANIGQIGLYWSNRSESCNIGNGVWSFPDMNSSRQLHMCSSTHMCSSEAKVEQVSGVVSSQPAPHIMRYLKATKDQAS